MVKAFARRSILRLCLAAMALAYAPMARAADADLAGEQLYASTCARCHGDQGAGTDEREEPLEGDLSVAQLAELIAETMPEDDPGSLTTQQAESVAAYIHDAFYSAIARARNRPARIDLVRLTVRQHRRALADLIGSFAGPAKWPVEGSDQRGLRGDYYNSRQPQGRGERAARRLDPQVDFDFGAETPVEELKEPRIFSIRWRGAVLAPETGEYQFIVRTEHAARLWINDDNVPLIDAWVKSGDQAEYQASQYLIGGRPYHLRLEFTKAKQGVDDSDKQKDKPPAAASIALLWKRPQGRPEPIPTSRLSPESIPETFICAQPFPPDDRSLGWERGVAVSQAWDAAATAAALDAAGYVADRLNELADTRDAADDREEKLRAFCAAFAERAFRQPLNKELTQRYIDDQFDAVDDPAAAVRRIVLLVLKSPRFLFREIGGKSDAYDVASRLSFGLWDSIPDEELLDAAKAGRLATEKQVRRRAERMLKDVRAQAKLREFLLTWLSVEAGADLSKDTEKFPEFDAAFIADLRASLELFLDEVLASERADYRELLLADDVYVNARLAKFYGAESPSEAGFEKVRLDDGQRAGVLTHPYVMARFAHVRESSPIHRGVFLARGVLGQMLRPPPEAFTPLPAELHPELTTRERVALQTKPAQCMACHTIINPLGFTLERFDAVGRYRETDGERPVDDAAAYQTRGGKTVTLNGARALAEFLAGSDDCHAAFTQQLFHHLVQQPVRAYGPTTLEELRDEFVADEFNIRKLAVEIMVASALVGRETDAVVTTQSAE